MRATPATAQPPSAPPATTSVPAPAPAEASQQLGYVRSDLGDTQALVQELQLRLPDRLWQPWSIEAVQAAQSKRDVVWLEVLTLGPDSASVDVLLPDGRLFHRESQFEASARHSEVARSVSTLLIAIANESTKASSITDVDQAVAAARLRQEALPTQPPNQPIATVERPPEVASISRTRSWLLDLGPEVGLGLGFAKYPRLRALGASAGAGYFVAPNFFLGGEGSYAAIPGDAIGAHVLMASARAGATWQSGALLLVPSLSLGVGGWTGRIDQHPLRASDFRDDPAPHLLTRLQGDIAIMLPLPRVADPEPALRWYLSAGLACRYEGSPSRGLRPLALDAVDAQGQARPSTLVGGTSILVLLKVAAISHRLMRE